MDLRAVRCSGMDMIILTRDRGYWRALMNTVMNLWIP
jgi:hypothetical protein